MFLEKLLNADAGDHRGSRIPCGQGHEAALVDYRIKQVTTVLSEIGIKRAYYHCQKCGKGLIPKDKDLDLENTSFSPGVRRMMARVGAKESFEDGRSDSRKNWPMWWSPSRRWSVLPRPLVGRLRSQRSGSVSR